nr:hypothetical protein [Tanacetum cinerariifolium]
RCWPALARRGSKSSRVAPAQRRPGEWRGVVSSFEASSSDAVVLRGDLARYRLAGGMPGLAGGAVVGAAVALAGQHQGAGLSRCVANFAAGGELLHGSNYLRS